MTDTHIAAVGNKFKVVFVHTDGRMFETQKTSSRTEAEVWSRIIKEAGWCISARPRPAVNERR